MNSLLHFFLRGLYDIQNHFWQVIITYIVLAVLGFSVLSAIVTLLKRLIAGPKTAKLTTEDVGLIRNQIEEALRTARSAQGSANAANANAIAGLAELKSRFEAFVNLQNPPETFAQGDHTDEPEPEPETTIEDESVAQAVPQVEEDTLPPGAETEEMPDINAPITLASQEEVEIDVDEEIEQVEQVPSDVLADVAVRAQAEQTEQVVAAADEVVDAVLRRVAKKRKSNKAKKASKKRRK